MFRLSIRLLSKIERLRPARGVNHRRRSKIGERYGDMDEIWMRYMIYIYIYDIHMIYMIYMI